MSARMHFERMLGIGDHLTAQDVACPYCDAKVGEWCTVKKRGVNGDMAHDTHEARFHALRGYRTALVDVQEALDLLFKRDSAEQEATG